MHANSDRILRPFRFHNSLVGGDGVSKQRSLKVFFLFKQSTALLISIFLSAQSSSRYCKESMGIFSISVAIIFSPLQRYIAGTAVSKLISTISFLSKFIKPAFVIIK
ncbi:MAG: hypothetical protein HEEMFOPI_02024 [Holosporales bacterium]